MQILLIHSRCIILEPLVHTHMRSWDASPPRGSLHRSAVEEDGLKGARDPRPPVMRKPLCCGRSSRSLAMECLALLVSKKPLDRLCAYFVIFVSFVVNIIITTNLFRNVFTDFYHKDHKAHKELTKNVELSRLRRPRPTRAKTRMLAQAHAREPTGGCCFFE
jgi:hypothetical protein